MLPYKFSFYDVESRRSNLSERNGLVVEPEHLAGDGAWLNREERKCTSTPPFDQP
jgi:hypothetical protein